MANMSIEELIEEIEVYVDNCKTAGVLSSGSMIKINREELLAMLDEVRTRLPKELAESRQIIKSKESIIADAKARAERIVKDAAKEAGVMIDDNEIVALANMRADSIVKDAQKAADELNGKARETAREVQTGALQYTQNMLEGLEYMYSTIIKEEKESGKRLKCKDSIRYSANPQTARTQLLEDAIASSRSYLSKFDKDLINQTKSISKSELIRRILARTGKTKENRQGLQFDVDFIYSKNELERAKILIKRNMDEMDKTLKQGYIDALMIIGKNLNLYGVLNEYVQRQNEQSRRMGFDNVMQISSDSVFNTEKLEKMSLHKLAALYAFWTNRFVKVVLLMYKSYIIMYELGLDTKDKIDDDRNFREVSKGKIKALGIKFAFVYLQAKKMYDEMYEKAMKRAKK